MSLVSVLFKTKVRIGVNASDEFLPFGAVEMDASISESHKASNELTKFPVEVGVDISDHVRRQPNELQLTCVVTNHPLFPGGGLGGRRSLSAYYDVLTMLDEAQLVDVVTSLRTYTNMVIESLEVPRDDKRGESVEMKLGLREVLTVEIASTAGTTDLGTQNATVL